MFAGSFNYFSFPPQKGNPVFLAFVNFPAFGEPAWAQCRFLSGLMHPEDFYFKVVYSDVIGKETTKPPYYLGMI